MPSDDPNVKALLPFLQRAEELQKAMPKVAYYLRLHCVEQGMKAQDRSSTLNDLLVSILQKLEDTKGPSGIAAKPEDDHLEVERFVLDVFDRADKKDRAGQADERTASTFYAASIFLQMLEVFDKDGALPDAIGKRAKYALWRAAEIRKALREGRQPAAPSAPATDPAPQTDGADGADHANGNGAAHPPPHSPPPPPPPQPPRRTTPRATPAPARRTGARARGGAPATGARPAPRGSRAPRAPRGPGELQLGERRAEGHQVRRQQPRLRRRDLRREVPRNGAADAQEAVARAREGRPGSPQRGGGPV
ncbi:unnamed protein product [Pedinophyceae sp. YPF-701]|nr:unnamed protein product [Pedinophyceae sp. YPF-701]